jgi:hypothetical protein
MAKMLVAIILYEVIIVSPLYLLVAVCNSSHLNNGSSHQPSLVELSLYISFYPRKRNARLKVATNF